jgi:uncharacterized protein
MSLGSCIIVVMPVQIPIDQERITAFCRAWRITELSLFGSVLRDDFGPESDVDVLVRFENAFPWMPVDLLAMRQELSEIVHRPVDLIWNQALRNPFRRREILATRRVIYAA